MYFEVGLNAMQQFSPYHSILFVFLEMAQQKLVFLRVLNDSFEQFGILASIVFIFMFIHQIGHKITQTLYRFLDSAAILKQFDLSHNLFGENYLLILKKRFFSLRLKHLPYQFAHF